MPDLVPYVPVLLQVLILVGAIYTVRAGRPKQQAEAKQAEARATVDLVTGFGALLAARQQELDDAIAKLRHAEQKAALVSEQARRIEDLEADLRRANQTIAALRDAA